MRVTNKVKKILSYYSSHNPGTISNLCRILMHGELSGTGKMVILPVDQGFEHGPTRSFAKNPDSYDPDYHFKLAINSGLNAYAAPLGMLEASSCKYIGEIPTILKMNSSNSLATKDCPDQAITASVEDALRLGCCAVGITIYPGSPKAFDMIEEAKEIICRAKSYGLAVIIWSYPRGGTLTKKGESAMDVCAYAAHIAALIGAHIIKVKPPNSHLEQKEAADIYKSENIPIETLEQRVSHIMQSCFNNKRLLLFSGAEHKSDNELMKEVNAINKGGASGSIIGRNSFQRPHDEAVNLLKNICKIYKS